MYIVVLITTKNVREANKIAKKLLNDKLIACANVVKGIKSLFWWQKKIDAAKKAPCPECGTKGKRRITEFSSKK